MESGQSLGDIGEFGLIDRISRIVGGGTAVMGIGDDAAVLDLPGPDYLLATMDILVEDVHFHRDSDQVANLGQKALAVNLSDIAAMGGVASYALISIAVPATLSVQFVDDLYAGITDLAMRTATSVVGGNVARTSGPITLDVAVLGHVRKEHLVLRSGAKIGDVLAVTGVLGQRHSDRLLAEADNIPGSIAVPVPRLQAGQTLAALQLADAMMDLSDGLGSDIHRLAQASNVGAAIYENDLPIAIQTKRAARSLGFRATEMALYGGDDYELLIALAPEKLQEARGVVDVPLFEVGTVLHPEHGVVLQKSGGARVPLPVRGWRHF